MADILASRVVALIEQAFDENVKEAARAEWAKVSGKVTSVDEAELTFAAAIRKLTEIRHRQLVDAGVAFEESP